MITTADIFSPGKRRGPQADVRLREAAQAIYEGRGSREDAELLFGDLAEQSGYFFTTPPTATDAELRHREGARSVFARILFLLDVPMTELAKMQSAALTELRITSEEGER